MYQHFYTNNLKDRLPVEAEKSWRENLTSSLVQHFDYTEEYADICIVLGEENIFCHRLILSLNSTIMSDCEPWEDSVKNQSSSTREKVYSIKLIPEFDEHPHILRSIIRSFYCGDISIGYENIKVVYKFAKCYQVRWLTSYAQSMFGEILEAENYVDLFAFAEKFGKQNNKLILVCLSRLDSQFLKKLYSLETGNIFAFNYYCLKSVTSSDKNLLSAIEIFRLIADWAEDEWENRGCHIEILLFDIKYHRISKNDLVDFVYPWVMHTKGIEDSLRTSLMKLITKRIVESDQKEDFFQKGNLGLEITTMKVDKLLENIMRDMETKATSGDYSDPLHTDTLSAEEVVCVVKMRYPTADPLVKQCIIEYINDHKIIDNATVTDFIKLYEDNQEEDLRYVILKFLNGKSSDQAMKSVKWDGLSFKVVQEFIKEAVLEEMEYIRIECIMQWSGGVHFDEEKLDKLLSNLVCYYRIPEDYISFVLKPFLKNIAPNRTFGLVCGVHQADSINHCEEIAIQCVVKPLSKEFSLLSDTVQHINECKMWLQLQINAKKPLQLLSKQKKINSDKDVYVMLDEENEVCDVYMNCNFDYLLFDLKKPLNSYPIHSNASPSLAELRELFASYKELHILVMWIPTDTVETSSYQAPTVPTRSTAPPLPPREGSSKKKVKGWKIWKKI